MKNKNQGNKTILIAPEYAMADLAESHRMASIAKAFVEESHKVFVLGKGRYGYLFTDNRFTIEEIPFDNEWMDEKKFRQIHDLDAHGLEFITLEDLSKFVEEEVKLLDKIKPDIVITGFRPTMSISTKISKIPLVWVLSAVVSDLYFEKRLATVPFGQYEQLPFLRLVPH